MSNNERKDVDDVLAWTVIGLIYGAVMLCLWGTLFWQSTHG
jgi:hypothetical protein